MSDSARLRLQAVLSDVPRPPGMSVEFTSSFDLCLVEDRDGEVWPVQQADLDTLGLTADEAVTAALDATISEVLVRLDVRDHALPGGGSVRMASADGVPYVSAGVVTIAQLAGEDLPYGAFVGVPRQSALIICRVSTRASLDVLPVIARMVASLHDSAPDPCSRGVYWFVGGDAHLIEVEERPDQEPRLGLPAVLQDVVAALPESI